MAHRGWLGVGCALALGAAAWLGSLDSPTAGPTWAKVHAVGDLAVYRSDANPAAFLVAVGDSAVLIDAPAGPESLGDSPPARPSTVLLTHHHRDSCDGAAAFLKAKVPVRAPKASAEWLMPEAVAKFWQDSIPLRGSRTAYFVAPVGIANLDCSLVDGSTIALGDWTLTAVATPGHSRDHLAYIASRKGEKPLAFVGDAVTGDGKLWTPFTTDWDHWTDAGLKPAGESLRALAKLSPAAIFPARGPIVTVEPQKFLETAAAAVEEAGFLKSFERYTNRVGNPPQYDFLVPKEQVATAGDKPWSKVSEHLWITGNTYVLASKDKTACLVLDPFGKTCAEQVEKLRKEEKLGPVELVAFSHAHYDHYDAVHVLPEKGGFKVWSLDIVAEPLIDPFRFRAPFLDARPIRFDRIFKDQESGTWRDYRLTFHALPGQTAFTCGIETTVDGKRCLFTADNFFHQKQFSGTGGWMGMNRSSPAVYGTSAQKVLDLNPEWILAEHGGPYIFDAEDYKRRVKWGAAAATAADALSPGGSHRDDWTPHRVSVEPCLQSAVPGAKVNATIRIATRFGKPGHLTATLRGRGLFPDQTWTFDPKPGAEQSQAISFALPAGIPAGRHVFPVAVAGSGGELCDPFLAVDVGK